MDNSQMVILVNERDEPVGTMEKMQAHREPTLHRAFSVFIFNSRGEMLLQQRALGKYHSGGLWTNACCSHPHPGENTGAAAQRRLKEELGFDTPLEKIFEFTYQSSFDNGLSEYEFDHVFSGWYESEIQADEKEVMDYCYKSMDEIRRDLETNPDRFTPWFRIAFPRVETWMEKKMQKLNS